MMYIIEAVIGMISCPSLFTISNSSTSQNFICENIKFWNYI